MEATATFRVAEVRDNILSLGKLARKGLLQFGSWWVLDGTAGKCRSTWNETVCVWKVMFCSANRDLDARRRERLSRMSAMGHQRVPFIVKFWPSCGGATPAPELKTWSSIKELHSPLRELGASFCGTKVVLFEWEEGVGGGYRTGDTKDPPWSTSTI